MLLINYAGNVALKLRKEVKLYKTGILREPRAVMRARENPVEEKVFFLRFFALLLRLSLAPTDWHWVLESVKLAA